ncbi:MAG TPA: 4Fe-4S dicluster domain-containing protein [Dehalococcoidia bacterium]|nr:4Fe-4S dicluster domain-containing protein [Dehalococcoidia bacterium]
MAEKAIMYDATKCTACRGCQVACKQWNELEGETTTNWGSYENPKDLSTQTWLKMEFREVGNNGDLRWLFTRRSCMHCTDAACVKVCPTGALFYHPLGFVSYDKGKCSGCGYCKEFCPYNVPRLNTNRGSGLGRMDKCTACTSFGLDRIDNGYTPACVKTCPTGALIYGDRSDLLAKGQARVQQIIAQGYKNAYLYGDKEVGGTHVLYVLEDSPSVYGVVENPKVPGAAIAWQDVIKPLGYVAVGLVGIGLLLNVMVARARMINGKGEK